ncbi:O-antigen ligase [Terribacillus sp. AE2B 122]|uniref:O-antigen ligase family protein n=1 Tax=Terribacillus sp. AE2B 122 TaxID=1331902 RepID=UPI001440E189|nr:O-antigen ligase family protein [Terribacillus sp. AE2B 122]VVM33381.1 O-antigen polymerase [Terribacillus sp. AE2B 122]
MTLKNNGIFIFFVILFSLAVAVVVPFYPIQVPLAVIGMGVLALLWIYPKILVGITVIFMPFSFIPYELGIAIDSTIILFALIILATVRLSLLAAKPSKIEIFLSIFLVWVIISSVINQSELMFVFKEVVKVLSAVLVFRLAKTKKYKIVPKNYLYGAFIVVGIISIYQKLVGFNFLQSLGYVYPTFNYATIEGDYRPFGTFYSPTVLGCFIGLVGTYLLFDLFKNQSTKMITKLAFTGLFFGVLVLTETRAAWISVAIVLLLQLRIQFQIKVKYLLLAWIAVIVLFIFVVLGDFGAITERFMTLFNSDFNSNSERVYFWKATIMAVTSSFVAGFGSQDFASTISPYLPPQVPRLGHPHNTYLQILYTYGYVGFSIYVLFFIALLRTTFKNNRIAFWSLSVFAIHTFFEQVWFSFSVVILMFFISGITSKDIKGR